MYEFGYQLSGVSVPPGTNLLITGPPLTGKRRLALETLASGTEDGDGGILLTTRDGADRILPVYEQLADPTAPVTVIDAVTKHVAQSVEETERISYAASPTEMTEMGIKFSEIVESYDEQPGIDRTRVVVDSLTTLLLYANLQTVFRFMHVFTSRVENADAVGVYTIESTAHGCETMNTLTQLFDGVVRVDRDGEFTVELDADPAQADPAD
ncbi:RAD55 family ATPase [Haloarcula halophila]|uniref:RAD55 family ATPase n=1 Tax=Haloarcula TaxID=2237 RepID=UPI00360EAB09